MDVFGARLVQSRACGFGLISGLADGSGMTDLGGCLLRFSSPARACARQYSMNNGLLPERACWIAFAWSSRQLPNFIIDFGRWRRWFPVVLISIENRPLAWDGGVTCPYSFACRLNVCCDLGLLGLLGAVDGGDFDLSGTRARRISLDGADGKLLFIVARIMSFCIASIGNGIEGLIG